MGYGQDCWTYDNCIATYWNAETSTQTVGKLRISRLKNQDLSRNPEANSLLHSRSQSTYDHANIWDVGHNTQSFCRRYQRGLHDAFRHGDISDRHSGSPLVPPPVQSRCVDQQGRPRCHPRPRFLREHDDPRPSATHGPWRRLRNVCVHLVFGRVRLRDAACSWHVYVFL